MTHASGYTISTEGLDCHAGHRLRIEAARVERAYREEVARRAKCHVDDLDFTAECCGSKAPVLCVYPNTRPIGIGNRKCLFCGKDDWCE